MSGKIELPTCPACGMDSGNRMMNPNKEPPDFYIVCQICGFRTRPHVSLSAATKEWCKYKRVKENNHLAIFLSGNEFKLHDYSPSYARD